MIFVHRFSYSWWENHNRCYGATLFCHTLYIRYIIDVKEEAW